MVFRKSTGLSLIVLASVSLSSMALLGQDNGQDNPQPHRGRKYKAPPVVSHIEVTVIKGSTGKPIQNAAVIFHPRKDGKDDGNLEVKTDPEGKAIIDVIPTGSDLRVQVIANGFATFGQDYTVEGPTKLIAVTMLPPRAQVSAYTDSNGQPSQRKPGVQEPNRAAPQPAPAPMAPQ